MYTCIYICVYLYICMYIYIYIYVGIYTYISFNNMEDICNSFYLVFVPFLKISFLTAYKYNANFNIQINLFN